MPPFDQNPFDSILFTIGPVFITVIFALVFVTILVGLVRSFGTWRKNNASPILTVPVRVVGKRADVSHHAHHHGNDQMDHHYRASTTYYVTFQVESGDRMEFKVESQEYGLISEGDEGKLTFQGTRYLGFERSRDPHPGMV